MIMTKEVLFLGLLLIVCVIGTLGLRFFKSRDQGEGYTDEISEGAGVYMGYTDKWRPDIYVRPSSRHGFVGDKYTPIWLVKKKKEEEEKEEPEEEREAGSEIDG